MEVEETRYQIETQDILVRYLKPSWLINHDKLTLTNAAFQDLVQTGKKLSTDLRRAIPDERAGLQSFNLLNKPVPLYRNWTLLSVAWFQFDLEEFGIYYECDGIPTPSHCSAWVTRTLTSRDRVDLLMLLVNASEQYIQSLDG